MKEAKKITIILFLLLIAMTFPMIYCYNHNIDFYNILISISTGIIVSLVISYCQYFIYRKEIVNGVYDCYMNMYKKIITCEEHTFFNHYNVKPLYECFISCSEELSRLISQYS